MVIDFGSFYEFPRLLDRMLNEGEESFVAGRRQAAFPPLNIGEDATTIYVRAQIPGARMEDVELTLTDKTLILRGELQPEKGRYYRQERPTGPFQRIVRVNVPIDREGVKATMRNGVLQVALPKSEAVPPQTIHIQPR